MSGAPALLNNVHQGAHSAAYAQVLEDTKKSALIYPEKSVMPAHTVSDTDSDVDSIQSGDTDQGLGSDVGRVDVDNDGDSHDSGGEEEEGGESVDSEEEAEEE